MQRVVSTIAVLVLLVSTIMTDGPGVTATATAANTPTAGWPHKIATEDVAVVLSPPQATAWNEHRSLEVRVAVAVTKKGTQKLVLGTLEVMVDTHRFRHAHRSDFSPASPLLPLPFAGHRGSRGDGAAYSTSHGQ